LLEERITTKVLDRIKVGLAIWRDVLLASLAIQLVGLATPLFTQVIIDKVIAHHSESTLIVLGVALVVFMLFTSGMSWLRQYLVLHTGSRIDAVLGEKVLTAPAAPAAAVLRGIAPPAPWSRVCTAWSSCANSSPARR
jgi:ABC-type bacteriocin/lantibiotic exporter with double-glycine peptidase domain